MVCFDECPDNLAHFLPQVWYHVECFRGIYPDNAARVHAVATNLEGSTSGWLMSLHGGEAPMLNSLDVFMQILRERFEDPMVA